MNLPHDLEGWRGRHRGETMLVCGCGRSLAALSAKPPCPVIGVNDVERHRRELMTRVQDDKIIRPDLTASPISPRRALRRSSPRLPISESPIPCSCGSV